MSYSSFEEQLTLMEDNHWINFLKILLKKDGILYQNKPCIDIECLLDENDKIDAYYVELLWHTSNGKKCYDDDIKLYVTFYKKGKQIGIDNIIIYDYTASEEVEFDKKHYKECLKELKSILQHYLPDFKFRRINLDL